MMIWKKFKNFIIPLLILKVGIFVLFIFIGDNISISRDINFSNNNQQFVDSNSIVAEKQKLIRIVRNEDERGISIKIRGKRNSKAYEESSDEIYRPIVD
jgi:hypothetical protein